jgi:hypothetical protein
MTLDEAIGDLVRAERMLDVATLASHFSRLDRNHVFNLFLRGQLHSLMVMFRALDLKWLTLVGVLELRAKKRKGRYVADDADQRDFEAIDVALAQRTLRFLQVRNVIAAQPGMSECKAKPLTA